MEPILMKLRGGKRRLKQIKKWRQLVREVPPSALQEKEDYYYIRFRSSPLADLQKYKIPRWLKMRMLEALIDVASEWNQKLLKNNLTFDLQIWLNEFNFLSTELIFSQGRWIQKYQNQFHEGPLPLTPLPSYYQHLTHSKVDWRPKRFVTRHPIAVWKKRLIQMSPSKRKKMSRNILRRYFCDSSKEEIIEYDLGPIWVGRLTQ
jgi:hypothetical protein